MIQRALSTAQRENPEALLRGLLYTIDRNKLPPVDLITHIKDVVRDAINILTDPDPLQRRIQFVLLAIEQSTSVEVKHVNGKPITKVKIVDLSLYNWALDQVHLMAGEAAYS